jgi:hypothetical protein
MTPTHFRKPRTGERMLRVQFRNGLVSRHTYTADQLCWQDRGWDFDIVAVERA